MKSAPRWRAACGKYHGYTRHLDHNEHPCTPCADAWRRYTRDYVIRTRRVQSLRVDIQTLARLLSGPDTDVVRRAIGDEYADAIIEHIKIEQPDGTE